LVELIGLWSSGLWPLGLAQIGWRMLGLIACFKAALNNWMLILFTKCFKISWMLMIYWLVLILKSMCFEPNDPGKTIGAGHY